MRTKSRNILGWILILTSFLYFVRNSHTQKVLIGFIFLLTGFISVYFSFGKMKTGFLFLGTLLFLSGLLILMPLVFAINYSAGYFATSVFYMLGAANLILFIDNTKLKFHFALGVLLIAVAISIPATDFFWFVDLTVDKFIIVLLNIWPVLLIIIGIGLITFNKPNRHVNFPHKPE